MHVFFLVFLHSNKKVRNRWETPIPCPYRRSEHSSTLIGDTVYFFGGKSPNYENDIIKYNINKNEWVTIETSGKIPSGRIGSTLVSYNQCLYMFGGYDNYVQSCSDMYEFNLGNKSCKMRC